MSERKLRAGVVGVGHLGKHHARIYHQLPDVDLIGISDTNPTNLSENQQKFQCGAFPDFRDLISQVDLVSVAVPTTLHHDVASAFLEKNVHVLVEKPITSTTEDGRRLVDLAQSNKMILMVGQSERFNPAVAAASDFIKKPGFIEVHRLGPFSSRATDVDVVLDLMIHDIDLILNWVHDDLKEIHATGVPVLSRRIDIANARLEFKNGCAANITASRISLNATRKVRVFQEDSYISIDCLKQEIQCFRRRSGNFLPVNPMDAIESVPFDLKKTEPLVSEISSFVEAVKLRQAPPVSGEAGLKALEVCNQITDMIRSNPISCP